MSKQFTLGRKDRLKSRKKIEHLFQQGQSFLLFPYKVFWTISPKEPGLQFGVGVGTKHFKKAVDRNRVKRLTREAYRLCKPELAQTTEATGTGLSIFFVYIDKDLPEFDLVQGKTNIILKKLIKLVNEAAKANN